jgi:hypothetical protein
MKLKYLKLKQFCSKSGYYFWAASFGGIEISYVKNDRGTVIIADWMKLTHDLVASIPL